MKIASMMVAGALSISGVAIAANAEPVEDLEFDDVPWIEFVEYDANATSEVATPLEIQKAARVVLNSLGDDGETWTDVTPDPCGVEGAIACTNNDGIYFDLNYNPENTDLIVHLYAHTKQIEMWDTILDDPKYNLLFAGDAEMLADCMASLKGAGDFECSPGQEIFARNVWNDSGADEPGGGNEDPKMTFERVSGATRYSTARAAADLAWTDGPLFIATGDNYPDALSIGSVIAKENGNLLLSKKEITNEDLSFIANKNPSKIYLIGGEGVLSKSTSNKLSKIAPVERIGGVNRYETNQKIVKKFYPESSLALVATGRDYPDALIASNVGGIMDAPVLLVNSSNVGSVKKVLNGLKVEEVIVAGDTGVISEADYNTLVKNVVGHRAGGINRYHTASLLSSYLAPTQTVNVASGENFPDALVGGALGGKLGEQLLISKKDCAPPIIYKTINSDANVRFLGGADVLNPMNKDDFRVCL